jgi:hypothetical protein
MVAHDPYALPAYSSIFAGSAVVTDTAQFVSTTTLGTAGAGGQVISPQYSRATLGNWSLDPLNAPEKLEAMRCACRWVIYGPEFACHDCPGILETPEKAPSRGRHFGVAKRLADIPQGWLWRGRSCDVPHGVRYKAHNGDTWVWVMPGGTQCLADFSLILQDIARVDINSPTLQVVQPPPSELDFITATDLHEVPKELQPSKAFCPCPSEVKNLTVQAAVWVDACGNVVPDLPYYANRADNLGTDAALRSQINAAGLH